MKKFLLCACTFIMLYGCNSKKDSAATKNETPKTVLASADIQIKSALLAAPKEKKDSCSVYGYSADKQLILLRKGTNEMICLADNPDEPGFSVACYVKELEPFMQRGRDLRKQGIKDDSLFNEREKEVKAGTLQMPKAPAAPALLSTTIAWPRTGPSWWATKRPIVSTELPGALGTISLTGRCG